MPQCANTLYVHIANLVFVTRLKSRSGSILALSCHFTIRSCFWSQFRNLETHKNSFTSCLKIEIEDFPIFPRFSTVLIDYDQIRLNLITMYLSQFLAFFRIFLGYILFHCTMSLWLPWCLIFVTTDIWPGYTSAEGEQECRYIDYLESLLNESRQFEPKKYPF